MKKFRNNLHVYIGYLFTGAVIAPCIVKLTFAIIIGDIQN